jgi:hypothetical protein
MPVCTWRYVFWSEPPIPTYIWTRRWSRQRQIQLSFRLGDQQRFFLRKRIGTSQEWRQACQVLLSGREAGLENKSQQAKPSPTAIKKPASKQILDSKEPPHDVLKVSLCFCDLRGLEVRHEAMQRTAWCWISRCSQLLTVTPSGVWVWERWNLYSGSRAWIGSQV